jgi:hypothetical protein
VPALGLQKAFVGPEPVGPPEPLAADATPPWSVVRALPPRSLVYELRTLARRGEASSLGTSGGQQANESSFDEPYVSHLQPSVKASD